MSTTYASARLDTREILREFTKTGVYRIRGWEMHVSGRALDSFPSSGSSRRTRLQAAAGRARDGRGGRGSVHHASAMFVSTGNFRLRNGESFRPKRRMKSGALVIPIRVPVTTRGRFRGAVSETGARTRDAPSK